MLRMMALQIIGIDHLVAAYSTVAIDSFYLSLLCRLVASA
jgi:hypothetical protein